MPIVGINEGGQIVDEFDDDFSQVVSGRGFAGEEENSRRRIHTWIFPQPVVKHHDAKRIEQLPLVFVDALDLAVENAVGVYRLAGGAVKPVDELGFGFACRLEEGLMKTAIIGLGFQLLQLAEILDPPITDGVGDGS